MRWVGFAAAIVAGTIDVLYLGIMESQIGGNPQFLRGPFVAGFIALMAISAALSVSMAAAGWRPLLLGIAAAGLMVLGFFAIFSIGLPLFVAGVLALVGAVMSVTGSQSAGRNAGRLKSLSMAVAGAIASIVVLLAGFAVTELAIRCPVTGTESGSGTTLLGSPYQYSCDNGKLTISE